MKALSPFADPADVTRLAFLHLSPDDVLVRPPFSADITTYRVRVRSDQLQVTVAARALHCSAQVRLMGAQNNTV